MSLFPLTVYTVTMLTQYIKGLFDGDLNLQSICVRGEVSNFSAPTSGHLYFTLKDATGRLRAVMFRGNAGRLRFRPAEGMKVIAIGSVSVYEKGGDYQLYVEQLEPEGKGALYAAFEQLKERLEQEGLFAQGRKRAVPVWPQRIAVLTSSTGAAVHDIITVARRRWPGVALVVVPTVVQGVLAPDSIVESLDCANKLPDVDVIILGRGGGSIEELWAFNEETVARAIANSRVPVVSAVGHETDFTIADFVADLRAPTPSGAAELVVPDVVATRAHLRQLGSRLGPALARRVEVSRARLRRIAESWGLAEPRRMLAQRRQDVDMLSAALVRAVGVHQAQRRSHLAELAAGMNALSPLRVLSRGYSICTDLQGIVISSARSVLPGCDLRVRLADGTLGCVVSEVDQ